ncbi:MAG: hypothetical protein PUD55_06835 [Firmicutes bacterium]|nr:hypothetical protein [Bacillota bacterium]
MIKKVIGLNLNLLEESNEVICGVSHDIASKLDAAFPLDVDCEVYSFPEVLELAKTKGLSFDDETVVVLGVPAIKCRIPLPCLKLIQHMTASGTMTVAVVTYGGNSYGRALSELNGFMQAQGFNIVSAAAFITKHASENKFLRNVMEQRPDIRDFEMMKVFGTATSNKIVRLSGSEVELLKVKPAPIECMRLHKAAAFALVSKFKRKEPEWRL